MEIVIVNGKPYIAHLHGYTPIDEQTYYNMIERSEISHIEVIDHD